MKAISTGARRCLVLVGICACSGSGGSSSGPAGPSDIPPPVGPPPSENPAPTVALEASAQIAANDALEIRIQAADESGLGRIELDWGDGTTETIQLAGEREAAFVRQHVYDRVGVFGLRATAVDAGGASAQASRTVATRGGSVEVALVRAANSAPLLFSARTQVTGMPDVTDRVLRDGERFVFPNVVPGAQEARMSELTADCVPAGPSTSPVTVEVGEVAMVEFEVACDFVPAERILYQHLVVTGPSFFLDNIHTARPDGSDRMQLTHDGGNQFPVFSPDGSRIAWHGVRTRGPQIWIMNWNGSEQRRITDQTFSTAPSWSPDGKRIAFQSSESGNPDIWTMRPDGSDPVRLTTDPLDESAPHWSTSGSRIAFSVGPSNVVHVMNADGTGRRSLDVEGTWPSWSPDDARIVFHSRIDDQIWIVNADGSGARALTALPVDTGAPSFSPDGRSVIFHAPRTGTESRLWIVDPDGGAPRLFDAIPDPGLSHATWIAP